MPVVIDEQSFYNYVCEKLNSGYPLVSNDDIFIMLAELDDDAFRVTVSKNEGRLTKYYPRRIDGVRKPFIVADFASKPSTTKLNLTAYGEIPAFIQTLIDEYSSEHPQHVISIILK